MTALSYDEAEALARRARALLEDARRPACRASDGTPVPLHAQDRRRWDWTLIAQAMVLVDRALGARDVGVHTLRAAIDALHAQAREAAATDWHRIAALYDLLAEVEPSPAVQRERRAAHARRERAGAPAAGGLRRRDAPGSATPREMRSSEETNDARDGAREGHRSQRTGRLPARLDDRHARGDGPVQ
jgi:predicted RNA polymerase sigma factor